MICGALVGWLAKTTHPENSETFRKYWCMGIDTEPLVKRTVPKAPLGPKSRVITGSR